MFYNILYRKTPTHETESLNDSIQLESGEENEAVCNETPGQDGAGSYSFVSVFIHTQWGKII